MAGTAMMGLFNRKRPQRRPPERLLSYQVANLQGLGTRERQEDSFAFANALDVTEMRRKGLLAIVADGMGGLNNGKLVSDSCVKSILASFLELDREDSIPQQLRDCVFRTSEQLYAQFHGDGGTTLVGILIFQENLHWISVGDSYIYLKRGRGLYRLNREQNFRMETYLELIRSGDLDTTEIDQDPDAPRLSEFLGRETLTDIDQSLYPLPLEDGDRLLLCSDGVAGGLSESVIAACLEAERPAEACSRLEAEIKALEWLHQDNYTALVIQCGQ